MENWICNFCLSVAACRTEQICPLDTLPCCWYVKQPTNKPLSLQCPTCLDSPIPPPPLSLTHTLSLFPTCLVLFISSSISDIMFQVKYTKTLAYRSNYVHHSTTKVTDSKERETDRQERNSSVCFTPHAYWTTKEHCCFKPEIMSLQHRIFTTAISSKKRKQLKWQ